MARLAAFLAAWALVVPATARAAVPEVLIWQKPYPPENRVDPNVQVDVALADEFDAQGRVVSIVWSMTDPLFRASVEAGRVSGNVERPTEDVVRSGAKALKVAYLLIVQARKKDNQVVGEANLYQAGTGALLWGSVREMSVQVGGLTDWASSAQSICRTWSGLLAEGPFKPHPPRRRIETPDPEPGVLDPTTVSAPPIPRQAQVDPAVYDQAESLLRQRRTSEAVLMLRDAVDVAPIDPKPRRALIEALLSIGRNDMAAEEARRAGTLLPDSNEFRLLAARAWLAVGKPDEAQRDLSEALAHAADDPLTHVLRGDIFLSKGEPSKAIDPFTIALAKRESGDARLGRALARGLSGDAEGCRADLAEWKPGDTERAAGYSRAVALADAAVARLSEDIRQGIQLSTAQPKSAEAVQRADRSLEVAGSLAALFEGLEPSPRHQGSHAHRKLALALLAQSAAEWRTYAESADDESGSEATISLSEALKRIASVRREYEAELAGR